MNYLKQSRICLSMGDMDATGLDRVYLCRKKKGVCSLLHCHDIHGFSKVNGVFNEWLKFVPRADYQRKAV